MLTEISSLLVDPRKAVFSNVMVFAKKEKSAKHNLVETLPNNSKGNASSKIHPSPADSAISEDTHQGTHFPNKASAENSLSAVDALRNLTLEKETERKEFLTKSIADKKTRLRQ